jgi:hypothetical protein
VEFDCCHAQTLVPPGRTCSASLAVRGALIDRLRFRGLRDWVVPLRYRLEHETRPS